MDLFTDRKKLLKMKAKKIAAPSSSKASAAKDKGKKRKRPASSDVVVDADYSIISLLDQMGDSMRGGAASGTETLDERKPAAKVGKSSKKLSKGHAEASPSAVDGAKKKKKRMDDEAMPPPSGKAALPSKGKAKAETLPSSSKGKGKAKAELPPSPSSSDEEESEEEEEKSYAGVSEWELWRPGVVAPLDQLNLPWAIGGVKSLLPSVMDKKALPQIDPRYTSLYFIW